MHRHWPTIIIRVLFHRLQDTDAQNDESHLYVSDVTSPWYEHLWALNIRLKITSACNSMICTKRSVVQAACILIAVVLAGCGSNPNLDGARLDLRDGHYDRALENIDIALRTNPNNASALSLKGEVLLRMANEAVDPHERAVLFSEMAHSFGQSARIDSTFLPDQLRLMRLAFVEQFNAGIGRYENAQYENDDRQQDAFQDAAWRFHAASMIFPDSASAYFNEAAAYYSAGMLDAASRVFRLALGRGMRDRELFVFLASTLETAAGVQADSLGRQEMMQEAVAVLHEATAVHPEDQELRSMLLNALIASGDDVSARAFYERELPKERQNKVFLYNYGTLLVRLGKYDEAAGMLSAAVDLDPDYTNARFNLGAAYVNKAVGISTNLRKEEEDLAAARSRLTSAEWERREAELRQMEADRKQLFNQAIEHLVVAKTITEAQVGDTRDICFVLYQAYGHIEMRQKAEEVAACAQIARD